MFAVLDKIVSTSFARKLAKLLIPHEHNNHHPYLIRHEALFVVTFIILALQFFSFPGLASTRVLGYATNITRAAVINLTNQERVSRGVAPLVENQLLNLGATMKAQDMFAKDYWAHYAPDGTSPWYFFKAVGYAYSWAGENLARDFYTSEGVVAGWMGSTSHRDNLLNPNFSDIGIGIQDGILGGEETTLVVQHLGKSLGISSGGTSVGTSKPGSSVGIPSTVEDSLKLAEQKPVEPQAVTANLTEVHEKIGGPVNTGLNLQSFWKGLGFGQRSTLMLLGFLVALFIADSVILFRKGYQRENSHSILHAGVLAILIVALIRSASGGVL